MVCQTPGTGEIAIGRKCFRVGRAHVHTKKSQQCVNLGGQAEGVRESFLQLLYESSGFLGSQDLPSCPKASMEEFIWNLPLIISFSLSNIYLHLCVPAWVYIHHRRAGPLRCHRMVLKL